MSSQIFSRKLALLIFAVYGAGLGFGFAQTNSGQSARARNSLQSPPPFPIARAPVDFFRELLSMSSAERDKLLGDRSSENKEHILAKVREYESMKPDDRELRLRATELRWYLLTLMPLDPTNRVAQLSAAPELMRKLVEDRLAEWDKLSPAAQQTVLESEESLQQLLPTVSATQGTNGTRVSQEQLRKFEDHLARVRALPVDEQKLIAKRFNDFFGLTPEEKSKVLRALSETERKEMEKTLQRFASLPKSQRDQCMSAFNKLAGMTPEERRQFLQNAERWQTMAPSDREAWRDLVQKLPPWPPLPPGLDSPPLPPSPPGLRFPVVSTNRRAGSQL